MLIMENVSKAYRLSRVFGKSRTVRAVTDLSLTLDPGAFGLLGINGAGKTTTIKMLSTLLLPSSGRITMDGLDVVRQAAKVRPRLNMIAGGERMLYYRLTGRENLLYFASLYGLTGRRAAARAVDVLRLIGLGDKADIRVEQYSKGMKQRLCIARGLINDPDYLFLDEPTLGLDVQIARELRGFIKDTLVAERGKTVILTSHYMEEIEEICPRLGILNAGRLVFLGTRQQLYDHLGLRRKHHFEIGQDLPGGLDELQRRFEMPLVVCANPEGLLAFEIQTDADIGHEIIACLSKLGIYRISYRVEQPALEDALLLLAREGGSVC